MKRLLKRFKNWCDQEYGRRAKAAEALGVSRQVITNWLAGRQQLTGEQVLLLQEFLEKQNE